MKKNKILKLAGIVLCLIMLCGAMAMVASAEDDNVITTVHIYGIDGPVPGKAPDFSGTTGSDAYCIIQGEHGVYWSTNDNSVKWNCDSYGTFAKDAYYKVKVYIEPNAGYEFPDNASDITAYFGGGNERVWVYKDSNGYYVQQSFDKCGKILTIAITTAVPEVGAKPEFKKVNDGRYYSDGNVSPEWQGVKWYDETEKKYMISGAVDCYFKAHHTYTVSYSIYAVDPCEIGDNTEPTALVNGKKAKFSWYNPVVVDVSYTFETGCDPEFVEPQPPSCDKTGHVGYYACSCGKWYWDKEATNPVEDKEEIILPPTGAHSGGTATCKAKAKCTECGKEYGSLKNHDYKAVTTKATLSKNGKIESKCSVCGNVSKTTTVYYPKTIKLSKTEYTYNGKVQTPSVTVKDSKGNTLKKDTDYTVKYESGRKAAGKYTVTITFKGKYTGTKTLTYTIVPKVTSKITATQTTTTITLKWNKVTGADGYRVYKYNSKTKKYEKLKDVTKNTLKIEKLKAGTAYKYKVKAYTKDDGTIWGDSSKVFETATKCKTPSITKLTTTKGKASFVWSNIAGETGYQVYYSTKKDSDYKKVASYKTNVVKGSKSKLKSGKKYYFKVRAYKKTASGTVYSSWSAVKSIKVK